MLGPSRIASNLLVRTLNQPHLVAFSIRVDLDHWNVTGGIIGESELSVVILAVAFVG